VGFLFILFKVAKKGLFKYSNIFTMKMCIKCSSFLCKLLVLVGHLATLGMKEEIDGEKKLQKYNRRTAPPMHQLTIKLHFPFLLYFIKENMK